MHASQILDMQVDFVSRMQDDPRFRKYVYGCHDATATTMDADGVSVYAPKPVPSGYSAFVGQRLAKALETVVHAAYAYRVTEDMCSLVEWAASQLDGSDRFSLDMVPTGCGIVRFDKPLPLKDVRGRTMLIHWAMWGPIGAAGVDTFGRQVPTLGMWFWNDLDAPDEVATIDFARHGREETLALCGRWGFVGSEVAVAGQKVGTQMTDISEETAARILAEGDIPSEFTNPLRYMMALWMLLDQTITDVSEEHVRNGSRKQAIRKGIPGRVSVVQLRRIAGARSAGESLVEWSHRWIVRGHWKWQPCGEGRKSRVRIWINPYVKGPEDKPLVQTEKVYSLQR